MKKLHDQVIIYDDSCPMCTVYTAGFVKFGWLNKRIPFSEVSEKLLQTIDVDRGRHEIPLYDTRSGATIYGLDALFLIIGHRFPRLKPLFQNRIFRFFWKQIYWVITYNRRIIAGSPKAKSGLDCAPDRHPGYRWAYILLMLGVTLTMALSLPLVAYLQSPIFIGLGGLLALGLLAGLVRKPDPLSWIGHLVTVLFLTFIGLKMLPQSIFVLYGILIFSTYLLRRRWRC